MNVVPRYSYNDYIQWKEDWELINGYPYTMLPSATIKHQNFAKKIIRILDDALLIKNDCKCMVLYETDWKIEEYTVVRPDIMIIYDIDKEEDYTTTTPRLIVEVLSPSTRNKNRNEKFELYQSSGVPYYIIADPDVNSIEIFELVDNKYKSNNKISTFVLTLKCSMENTLAI